MQEHVVIVGGSSGMGYALAAELIAQGSEVTIAGRSPGKLDAVRRELGVRTVAMDIGIEADIERLFAATGTVSHIVTTAAEVDDFRGRLFLSSGRTLPSRPFPP